MSVEHFLDSNIAIYLHHDDEPKKKEKAARLVGSTLKMQNGCINYQVVQETLARLSGKFRVPLRELEAELRDTLLPLWTANPAQNATPTPDLYRLAAAVMDKYNYSFYDSVVIAGALEAGCKTLYTEDMHDGHQIESVTIANPFKEEEENAHSKS